jgi:Carboxypeptidase regulatory-like domain/TonB dependent receptor-like, beta-barrel
MKICAQLFLILCMCAFLLSDDLDHVSFQGIVKDTAGNPLAGALVSLRETESNNEHSMMTSDQGVYRFIRLAPGIYHLQVEANGFQIASHQSVKAIAGTTIRRDFQLQLATIEAHVTIDDVTDRARVDTTRTVVGGTVTKSEIDLLPVDTRNPYDLLFTLAGTTQPALSERDLAEGDQKDNFRRSPEETGIFSLTGGTPYSNNLTIEGLDNNDDRAARERFTPSINSVEEVQVITNQFSAEYGRASGGRVNLRLRGGSNSLNGQAFYYFRDESLNANSFTRNSDPVRGFRLPYQNHNPGGSIGGPTKLDRGFFFAAYEYDNIYDFAEISALVPINVNPTFSLPKPNGPDLGNVGSDRNGRPAIVNGGEAVGLYDLQVTTPGVGHNFQSRADFKQNGKHDLFALLTVARNNDERGFPGGRRTLETIRKTGRNSQSIALSDNFVVSNRLVNSARYQFSRLRPADAPSSDSPVVLIEITDPRDLPGNPDANPLSRSGNLTSGASTLSGIDRREDRHQIQETLSYVRNTHTFRTGGDLQIIRSRFVDLADTTGTFNFATPGDFLAGKPSRYQHRFNTVSELRNRYSGLFVQDDWRLRSNLTVALGLRWDHESILDDRNNIGPRVAVAWDPFGTNRTVIRLGTGIFYNRALLRTLDDYLVTSHGLRIDTNNEPARGLLTELRFPQVLAAKDPRVTELGERESGFLRRIDKNFRIPESYQASAGIEREISRGLKLEANYVFNRGLHLWREVNANAPRLPSGFSDFAAYLTSRDFNNSRNPITGRRPITATGDADLVRFDLSQTPSRTITQGNSRVVVIGLNNPSTSDSSIGISAPLAAIRNLRPNPEITQIEELQSRGNSYYHGASFNLSKIFVFGFLRVSYTLSKIIDDGVVNTSSPLVAGDFRRERSLSLLDARHRLAISGSHLFPDLLGRLNLSGTFSFSSSRPFNIGMGSLGNDRNLDDIPNDRPNFNGDLDSIIWRSPGSSLAQSLIDHFSLPAIGTTGDLPRNAGRGPTSYTLNLRLSREFRIGERKKVQFQIEAFNPLNSTVFSIGAEFVDFIPSSLSNFLVARRTVKPRTMRVGMKFGF